MKGAVKEAVYKRDGYQCVYCGSEENLSIDHKIPRKYGGSDDISNLAVACRKCNSTKGAKLEDTLKEQVVKISGWKGEENAKREFYSRLVLGEVIALHQKLGTIQGENYESDIEKENRLLREEIRRLRSQVEGEYACENDEGLKLGVISSFRDFEDFLKELD